MKLPVLTRVFYWKFEYESNSKCGINLNEEKAWKSVMNCNLSEKFLKHRICPLMMNVPWFSGMRYVRGMHKKAEHFWSFQPKNHIFDL